MGKSQLLEQINSGSNWTLISSWIAFVKWFQQHCSLNQNFNISSLPTTVDSWQLPATAACCWRRAACSSWSWSTRTRRRTPMSDFWPRASWRACRTTRLAPARWRPRTWAAAHVLNEGTKIRWGCVHRCHTFICCWVRLLKITGSPSGSLTEKQTGCQLGSTRQSQWLYQKPRDSKHNRILYWWCHT